MSIEAISWALVQPIKHSSAKFVLVVMANCADQNLIAWPSTAYLSEATSQDRKTVLENLRRLREMGYLEDTGERKGGTGQVPVYRLKSPENGTVSRSDDDVDFDAQNGATVPKTGQLNSTENGTVPNLGPVPFFPINSTVFPYKQSQISHETVPKTGHGTVKEPSRKSHRNRHKDTHDSNGTENGTVIELPDWLPLDVWNDWAEYRKTIKAKLTPKAAQLCIKTLEKLRGEGHDPKAVIEQSIMTGKWTGLFPLKQQAQRPGQPQRSLEDINAEAYRIAFPDRGGIIDV